MTNIQNAKNSVQQLDLQIPEILVILTHDFLSQFDIPWRELGGEKLTEEILYQRLESFAGTPRVEVTIESDQLFVRVIGDARSRQVVGMSIGINIYLLGEEDGPIVRFTQPYGDDSLAVFGLDRDLPSLPSINIEWEDALQVKHPFFDELEENEERIEVRSIYFDKHLDFDEEAYYLKLLKEATCLEEEVR